MWPKNTAAAALLPLASAALLPAYNHQTPAANVTVTNDSVVYQFPRLGADLENIVVQPSGQLLVTRLDVPELWQVSPATNSASLVHAFSNASGLAGVAQIGHDEYAVISGYYDGADTPPGKNIVWKVQVGGSGHHQSAVTKIAAFPEALFLNDIEPLDTHSGLYLLSDSAGGSVWRLDVNSGETARVIEDETMKPVSGAILPIGINGIALRDDYLYYVNSFAEILYKIRVNTKTGAAVAKAEVVADDVLLDDFVFGPDGYIYGAGNLVNNVVRINPAGGEVVVIAGGLNSTEVAGDTSVAFGTPWKEASTLYVSTSGAGGAPVNGTFTEPGKVVALELEGLGHGWGY